MLFQNLVLFVLITSGATLAGVLFYGYLFERPARKFQRDARFYASRIRNIINK